MAPFFFLWRGNFRLAVSKTPLNRVRQKRFSALGAVAPVDLTLTLVLGRVKRRSDILIYNGDDMAKSLSFIALAAAFLIGTAATAQDTTTDADTATEPTSEAAAEPAGETAVDETYSTGREDVPATYVKESFDDWQLRCFTNPNGDDPCQLYQFLRDENGNPVAELSIFNLEDGAPAIAAGATVVVPLLTLLTEELKIAVDGGAAKSYPYRFCNAAACIAQIGLTADDIAAFKRGVTATLTLVPAEAPKQRVVIPVSLKGFTKGYEQVSDFKG